MPLSVPPKRSRQRHGPELERSVTLTDAVVAIAMTLLVLPLVDLAGDLDTHHVGAFLDAHWDRLLSFVISFLVIYTFWVAHGAAVRPLRARNLDVPALTALNMWWLLFIAFLPFPTAIIGRESNTVSVPIYIGTMLVISVLTATISVVAGRACGLAAQTWWAWLTSVVFAVSTALSLYNAGLGLFSLLLIGVARLIEAVFRPDREES